MASRIKYAPLSTAALSMEYGASVSTASVKLTSVIQLSSKGRYWVGVLPPQTDGVVRLEKFRAEDVITCSSEPEYLAKIAMVAAAAATKAAKSVKSDEDVAAEWEASCEAAARGDCDDEDANDEECAF